jgi:formamidopyrimidine-DNA glycosylase
MPEIGEAYSIAESIRDELLPEGPASYKAVVRKCTVAENMKFSNTEEITIEGSKTVGVFSRGKKVIIAMMGMQNENEQEFFLIFSLGMTGIFTSEDEGHARMILEYDIDKTIHFDDVRLIGSCVVASDYQNFLKDLMGPDLLQDNVSYENWERIFLEAGQRMQVASFMREQRHLAGVGNWLLSEILYKAGIMGDRKLNSITNEERLKLYDSTMSTVAESAEMKGLSIRDYRMLHGSKGMYKPKVYGVKGKNLDGYTVKNKKISGQTFWYVPEVQK